MKKINLKVLFICLFLILLFLIILYFINNFGSQYNGEAKYEIVDKYDANRYIPVRVTDSDIANKYLNDYKNVIFNDINEAYNLLNEKYRNEKFGSLDKFEEYIDKRLSNSFFSMTVDKYSINNRNGKKFFYIVTSSEDIFIFKENSIMNYEVYFDEYTIEIK